MVYLKYLYFGHVSVNEKVFGEFLHVGLSMRRDYSKLPFTICKKEGKGQQSTKNKSVREGRDIVVIYLFMAINASLSRT